MKPDERAKVLKVAKLADGTSFDGEKQKSMMVCLNMLMEKGNLTFLQIMEAALKTVPTTKEYDDRPPQEKYYSSKDDVYFGDGYGFDPRRQQQTTEDFFKDLFRDAQRQRKAEQDKKDAQYRNKKGTNAGRSSNYPYSLSEFNTVADMFFGIYKHERQTTGINKGMVIFISYYINKYESNFSAFENDFARSLKGKDGFELLMSEKQFNILIRLYRDMRELVYIKNEPLPDKLKGVNDILYKAFNKKGIIV